MARVLIVEDNTEVRKTFVYMLQRSNHEIIEAAGVVDGQQKIQLPELDIALVDIRLDGREGGGFEVAKMADRQRTWVLALTGSCLSISDESTASVFDEVILKPVGMLEFFSFLDHYLKKGLPKREPN